MSLTKMVFERMLQSLFILVNENAAQNNEINWKKIVSKKEIAR
jgi:hypothetical protein